MPDREAVLEAAKIRLRPRLMTTITTMIGFTPLALNLGEGEREMEHSGQSPSDSVPEGTEEGSGGFT